MCIDSCYSEPREPRARCGWCHLTQTHRLIKIYIIFFLKTSPLMWCRQICESTRLSARRITEQSHREASIHLTERFLSSVEYYFDLTWSKCVALCLKHLTVHWGPSKLYVLTCAVHRDNGRPLVNSPPASGQVVFWGYFFFLVCHVSTSLKRYDSHYFISLYLFRTKAAWYRGGKTDNAIISGTLKVCPFQNNPPPPTL